MPRHCSAGGCKSRDNRETRNAGITFHKLPKGATRRNLWITNSHRADSWDPQTDFVYFCSKHFTPESFELTGCSGIRRLKEDAFPTLFDSTSTTKCKRAGTPQRQEVPPVRKRLCSGDQEPSQQEAERQGQTSEEPTGQRSAASEQTHENKPASSHEPSELTEREHAASPPPQARPLSPSQYMRRLPPPPGFYLSKEHSYAQLCPLLWRRRYDQAIDCLEKALRQLHAARRRENRLRSTVLRLRDKRLKHTVLVSQDGCKSRGSWTPGGERRRGRGGSHQEESETDAKCEDTGLFEDRCVDHMELGWSEEEKGFCFYCGRGQVQAGQVVHRLSKTEKSVPPTEHEDSDRTQREEHTKDTQRVRLEPPPGRKVEINDPDVAQSQVLLQTPRLHHVIPAAAPPPDSLQLSDTCEGESDAAAQEHHLDLQQQLFWIQDGAEGQVILVPVPAEDGSPGFLRMEGVVDEAQTILVSQLDLKGDPSGGLACDYDHEPLTVINREDVREKLKEHLEGFHLQLSTEFIN
ncbi:THAP domain-containing protein 7 isoform X2 [Seriola aureovittata]|nr:THAP domain-containing protein 7 isoform X2 [Seriola aureovittata]